MLSDLCDRCDRCKWKPRPGFTTEQEWELAVSAEKDRLENHGKEELIGSWIAETPVSLKLNIDILDNLSSTLGVTLERFFVAGWRIS